MSTRIKRELPFDEYQAAILSNNASASNPFATISDVTSSDLPHAVASGTNTYTVTIPGVTAYTDGDAYLIRFTNGSAANSTININSLGVKILTKKANVQVTGGDIVAGQEMLIIYDGTNFQCLQTTANQLFAYVTNDDSVTITAGQPVYAFGAAGNRMSVKLANNTGDATSAQTVGLVFSSSIAPNQRGFVITQGVIEGLNTGTYNPGDQLYLGATAGSLTNVKPYAPNHLVYIGIVERANAGNGQIYVKPQNGYELNELHDVQLIGTGNVPLDGEVLTYEASTQLWKAKPVVSQNDSPLVFVIAATEGALTGAPTYFNGVANDGVGATLIATVSGVLSDGTAIGRIDTNYIPEVGDLILVKNETNQFHNGVYEISDTGTIATPYILTRSVDVDAPEELYPLQVNAFQGLVNGSKYFTQTNTAWGNATPPVVGFDNIIFALTSLTTSPLQITFVDHSTAAPLPTCIYTIGTDLTKPGVGATLSATAVGALVLSGMSAGSSTTSLTAFTTLLVRNQAELRHNGTYQVINPGSPTARWILRRIDDLAAGFNKALRIVFCSHNVSPFAGTYYTPTWNPTLINKNIGIVSFPVATNKIEYATFTPQAGRFGIANSNGAFTYYATLSSAMTAAVAGQTIEMFTDVIETGIVAIALKQGVDINGNGHTYTYTNSAGVMFTYILPGGVITTTINILNLNIVRTNAASTAAAVFGSFTNPSGTSTTTLNFINSTVTYTVTSGNTPIVQATAALHIVTVNGLTCTSNGAGPEAIACSAANFCTITCNGTSVGYRGGTISNSRIRITSGVAVELSTAISCVIVCTTAGIGVREGNATDTTITTNTGDCIQCGNVISQGIATRCNVSSVSGICYRRVITTDCTGTTGANTVLDHWFNYNDNTAKFRRNYFVCNSAVPAVINGTGGDFELVDSTIVQNGTGPGVRLYGSVLTHTVQDVINCTIILPQSSAANCITALAAPGNARFINNKFKGATTPINTNVVQFVVNTIDNQGNILL